MWETRPRPVTGIRLAGGAAVAAAVVVAVTALRERGPAGTEHQTDVRQGFAPWALVLFCTALAALSILIRREAFDRGWWTRVSTLLLPAGLAGAAFFFLTLAGAAAFAAVSERYEPLVIAALVLALGGSWSWLGLAITRATRSTTAPAAALPTA